MRNAINKLARSTINPNNIGGILGIMKLALNSPTVLKDTDKSGFVRKITNITPKKVPKSNAYYHILNNPKRLTSSI